MTHIAVRFGPFFIIKINKINILLWTVRTIPLWLGPKILFYITRVSSSTRRTFIRLQLWQTSYDRFQSGLVLFSSPYLPNKRVRIDFINRIPGYSKVVKNFIRLYLRKYSCVRFAVSIPSIHLSNKKTAID